MSILVTGGAGYIGTHACVVLLEKGYDVIVVDNLVNAKSEALSRVEKITGQSVTFYQQDIRDKEGLNGIFERHAIDSVMHFAGLKAVGESVEKPLKYYQNNVTGSIVLFEVMKQYAVKKSSFLQVRQYMVLIMNPH